MTGSGLLLDTHFLIWLRSAPEEIKARERQFIIEADVCFISIVSLWEVAVLLSKGRLVGTEELLEVPQSMELLEVTPQHCRAVRNLPFHHKDPSDRMLIAQSVVEGVPLLTRDQWAKAYASAGAAIVP